MEKLSKSFLQFFGLMETAEGAAAKTGGGQNSHMHNNGHGQEKTSDMESPVAILPGFFMGATPKKRFSGGRKNTIDLN